ncbi:isocitrate lyase/PEP mutase family protein [Ferruginibacter sp.]
MNLFEKFTQLHQQSSPLLLANIWDVNSAKIFEAANYQAIGISSAAISNAFGYEDGEHLPFDLLCQITKSVTKAVTIPLTVDMEGGYSRNVNEIITNIEKLHDAGAVGINLEDTVAGEKRTLLPADQFTKTLSVITNYLSRKNINMFLNIRTDGFLLALPGALEETTSRIKKYEETGIHGIFVPCITAINDIKHIVSATKLPVNVMCMPNLPNFGTLQSLGVKRISMGTFFFNKVYQHAGSLAATIIRDNNFSAVI